MHHDINAVFPNEVIRDMNFEQNIFNTNSKDLVISTYSQIVGDCHILRIYQLAYNHFDETYHCLQELAAFEFNNRNAMLAFLNTLPGLNGIEMLLLLNPVSQGTLN